MLSAVVRHESRVDSLCAPSPGLSTSRTSVSTDVGGGGGGSCSSHATLTPDVKADLLEKLDNLRVSCDDLIHSQTNLTRGREHLSFCIQVSTRPVNSKETKKERRRLPSTRCKGRKRRRRSSGDEGGGERTSATGSRLGNRKKASHGAFVDRPFGTQTRRFAYSGLHPDVRASACCDTPVQRNQLSPALYSPGAAAHSSERDAAAKPPSFFFRAPTLIVVPSRKNAERARWLAPGRYERLDWLQEAALRPSSRVAPGAYMSPGRRFATDRRTIACARGKIYREPLDRLMTVPGPGTYDAPSQQADSNRFHDGPGVMSTGGGRLSLPPVGSDLPPGNYNIPSSIDQLLQKVVSLKGPYAIFTSSRSSPVCVGSGRLQNDIQQTSQKMKNLGPGTYNPYPTKWDGPHQSFRNVTEAEREHIRNRTSKPAYPPLVRENNYPGPGQYEVTRATLPAGLQDSPGAGQKAAAAAAAGTTKKTSVPLSLMAINKALMWKCQFGFNSTTERKDKFTNERWGYSANPVGVGRYNVANASDRLVHVNGHCSVFNSACERNTFAVEMPDARAARSWERERARKAKKLELVRTTLLGPAASLLPPTQKQAATPAPAATPGTTAAGGEQRK